jgi:hypothetical protein
MIFQVYVVKGKKPDEWKDFIGMYESESAARDRVRQAIASGYDRGYIKQGFDVVAYLDESSFTAPPSKPSPVKPKKGPTLPK